jgi:hypothetical protein
MNFSNWWSGTKNPPPTDAAAAAADEEATRQHAAAARRLKAQAGILNEEPRHVSVLKRVMAARGRNCVARLVYTASVQITPAQLRSGSVPQQCTVRAELTKTEINIDSVRASGARAYLIAMDALECDSRQMPFSTVWRYGGEQDVYVGVAEKLWRAIQERGSRRSQPSVPLFNRQIGVEEQSLSIQFTSFEAVGFNDVKLMQNVAHITPSGLYEIPISYPYSGLLRNVHSACVLAHQRARWTPLEVETAPLTSYKIQHDDKFMLMRGEDLQRAVAYINKNLVASNVAFDIDNFLLSIEPFGGDKWLESWQKSLDAKANKAAVGSQSAAALSASSSSALPPPISSTIVVVVYVGLVPRDGHENGFAMPAQRFEVGQDEIRPMALATSDRAVVNMVNAVGAGGNVLAVGAAAPDGGRTMEMTLGTSDDEEQTDDDSHNNNNNNDDDDNDNGAHTARSSAVVKNNTDTGSKTIIDTGAIIAASSGQ